MKKNIIIYDFDGTLTPYPIPKFKIFEKAGLSDEEYQRELIKIKNLMNDKQMDMYETYYQLYLDILKDANLDNEESLSYGSDEVEYNKGLTSFLEHLNNNNINNYLLSSGIKDFLKHTDVAHYFKEIYGTTFNIEKGKIKSVDWLLSDNKKVDVIKDIIKKNNLNDCSSIVYIGDGITDLPAMEYVTTNGGTSIFVYLDNYLLDIEKIKMRNIVSEFFKADYSSSSELYKYIINCCNIKD